MAADASRRSITDHVDRHRDELVELLSDLVKIPTIFPSGDYATLAKKLEREFSAAGVQVRLIAAPRERVEALGLAYPRPNVVAQLGSGSNPVLLIGTHMDVVEPGDRQAWTHGPFSGAIADGKVWGRGACDAKSAIAAQVFAARAITESGFMLDGTLLLACSVDDEGGYDRLNWPGMAFLAEEGLASHGFPQPEMVINGEASGLDHICGSFKGRLVLEITVCGETAHASTSHGKNAVDRALLLIERLKALPLEEHPIQGRETLAICSINGRAPRYGDIPDTCRIGVDFRVVPPYGTTAIREKLRAVLDDLDAEIPGFRISEIRYLSEREPVEIADDHPLVLALNSVAAQVGVKAKYASILGTGDLDAFLRRGVPGVTYGPGSISRVHRPNEYVEIDALVQQTKIYALSALKLCRANR